jgi:malonyl-CoA O-methyltransferase
LENEYSLNSSDVRRGFDRAAEHFSGADFVHRVTCEGLFARLEPVTLTADVVVDLGCASGAAIPLLEKRFRRARIVGVDFSTRMLQQARAHKRWLSRAAFLQSDARALPFASHSVDVVFANMLLPWLDEPAELGREVCRVLRKDGLFVFATLGPDSLLPLRRAWRQIDNFEHVNRFLDMHDIGDALVRAGLRDPVLDVDRLGVSYREPAALFRDLTASGARNALAGRQKSLTGRGRFERMSQNLWTDAGDAGLELELELVYGHCWGRGAAPANDGVRIDAASIARRRH